MKRHGGSRLPLASTRLTAAVSVAMVLLLGGIMACLGVAARNVARDVKESMGFAIVMDEGATPAQIAAMKQHLTRARYVSSYTYSSPDEVLDRWQAMLGEDEDVRGLMEGVNPFAPEFEVRVREAWAVPDSLELLAMPLRRAAGVESVKVSSELTANVNSAVRTVGLVLAVVAGVLLVISFVLINNTVRLTIHARRFSIYTMRLVGATGAFIRRPIVWANMLAGLVAGLAGAAALGGALWYGTRVEPGLASLISPQEAALVAAGMVLAGILICWLASTVATNRYLRATQAKLYR